MQEQIAITTLQPHASIIELEQVVLGCCLVGDINTARWAAQIRSPKWFHEPAHQAIFSAIQAVLADEIQKPDIILVIAKLRATGGLEQAGGAIYVSELTSRVAGTANIPAYIALLIQEALRRAMHAVGQTLVNDLEDPVTDVFDEMQALVTTVQKIRADLLPVIDATADVELDALIEQLETRRQKILTPWDELTGISTGLTAVDEMTGGLQPGDLIIIGAQSSMGKTALACQFALSTMMQNTRVGFFSMEMNAARITARLAALAAEVPVHILKRGAPTAEEMERLRELPRHMLSNCIIVDTMGLSAVQLEAECTRLKRDHDIGLVVLDYIQLMDTDERFGNRNDAIGKITRVLKKIAVGLNIPFVALSQLNRSVAAEHPPIPRMNHLRDSGSIEQDADIVMMLWRPEYYDIALFPNGASTAGIANLIFRKQRDGPTATVALQWDAHFARFADLPGNQRDYIYPA